MATARADAEALALGVRGRTLATHGDLDAGLASLRAGIELADAIGNLQGRLVGVATVATILARWGRSREALADIDGAIAAADASGLARSLGAQLLAQAARASFSLGDWDAAGRRVPTGSPAGPRPRSRRSCAPWRSGWPSRAGGRPRRRRSTPAWRSSRRRSATRRARRPSASRGRRRRSRPGARSRHGRCSRPSSPHAQPGPSRDHPRRGLPPSRSAPRSRSRSTRGARVTRTPRPRRSVAWPSSSRSCGGRSRTPAVAGARSPTPSSPTSRRRRPGSTRTPTVASPPGQRPPRGWDAIDRPFYAAGRGTGSRRGTPCQRGVADRRSARPCGPRPSTARRLGAAPLLDRIRRLARLARVELARRPTAAMPARPTARRGRLPRRVRPAGDAGPHAAGARDPAPGCRGVVERQDRRRSRDQREHRVGPRVEHPREARRREPGRGGGARAPARGRGGRARRTGEPRRRTGRVRASALTPGSRTRPAPLLHGTGRGDRNVRWWIAGALAFDARGLVEEPEEVLDLAGRAAGRARASNATSATSRIE